MNALLLTIMLLPMADPVSQDEELVKAWLKVSQKHAEDYVIHPTGDAKSAFTMLPQAVFRHSQPVRGDDIGAVYLWVDADKRPAVIGTTFAFTFQGDTRVVAHEFHSLADAPLTATWRGRQPWTPKERGLEFRPVPMVPAASGDPKIRQRQAREIARRFSANSIDHDERRWELRLVTKPIHEFDVPLPNQVQCGSLFVLCQGTDPELILSVEARKQDNEFRWHYAAASFTDFALKLRLDDKEVWSAERRSIGPLLPHWSDGGSKESLPKVE